MRSQRLTFGYRKEQASFETEADKRISKLLHGIFKCSESNKEGKKGRKRKRQATLAAFGLPVDEIHGCDSIRLQGANQKKQDRQLKLSNRRMRLQK